MRTAERSVERVVLVGGVGLVGVIGLVGLVRGVQTRRSMSPWDGFAGAGGGAETCV